MRRRLTLREVLKQTLAVYPLGMALLSGSCGPQGGGECGRQVIIVPSLPDGGVNCSACGVSSDQLIDCYPISVNATPAIGCDIQKYCPGTGRRPVALVEEAPNALASAAGACFARGSRLEAASVLAFRVLARELEAHGASAALVAACHRAATEEIGHARMNAALARRYGAEPEWPTYAETPPVRTLEEIALENAREGCARETFGAVLGFWELTHSTDPVVVNATAVIAREELGHAQLAWFVAEWASERLGRAPRARIEEARFLSARSIAIDAPPSLQEMSLAFATALEA